MVRNGQSRSPLGSEMKGDISLKGISVQRRENIEGSPVKTIKESVWSNQSDSTHAMKDNSVQGIAPNGDLGNLEVRFNMSSLKQRDGAPRTNGKQQMGFLGREQGAIDQMEGRTLNL